MVSLAQLAQRGSGGSYFIPLRNSVAAAEPPWQKASVLGLNQQLRSPNGNSGCESILRQPGSQKVVFFRAGFGGTA
jgi:hypothetical protein